MNPMDLMKNVQQLQSRMSEAQARLKELVAVGTAGGDMVSVKMTGEFIVTDVKISPEAVDPDDVEMLQDLVRAAISDAVFKIREQIQQQMSSMTGGLNLPTDLFGGLG